MTRLLWSCAALLAAAAAAELAWPEPPPPTVPPPLPPVASGMAPAGQWDEWLPVLLARPPFAPDRRPDDAVAAIAAAPDTPRLAGILVSAGGRTALFTGGGNRTIVAREGAQVGPFAIKSIRPGEVVVSAPDGLRVLKPSFSPNNGLPAQ